MVAIFNSFSDFFVQLHVHIIWKTNLSFLLCQFAPGYQPTVGVDYGFKIETVGGQEGEY